MITPHPDPDRPDPLPGSQPGDVPGGTQPSGPEPGRQSGPLPGGTAQPGPVPGGPQPGPVPVGSRQSDFFGWIRGLGVARGGDRWLGGVSSGLAYRWGVDPILIRGLFIVAALFLGIGVLAYGLAWLLLPEPDGRIHLQEAGRGRWTAGMTGAVLVTILGLGGARAGFWFGERGVGGAFWGLFWVAVVAFAVYSIVRGSRRRSAMAGAAPAPGFQPGMPPTGTGQTGTVQPGMPQTGTAQPGVPAPGETFYAKAASAPSYAVPPGTPGTPGGPGAPGYASAPPPFYGTPVPTPAPVPPPPPVPRRRGPGGAYIAVVVGLTALIAGTLLALDRAGMPSVGATGGIWAIAAIALGLGIVVAGLRGRTAGILTLFAIVAIVSAGIAQGINRFADSRGPSRVAYAPATIADVSGGYDIAAAEGTVDLSALDNAGPLDSDRTVRLDVALSSVAVEIPQGIPVEVRTDASLSEVRLGPRTVAGISQRDTQTYNADRPGATLVLELDAALSSVRIEEEH